MAAAVRGAFGNARCRRHKDLAQIARRCANRRHGGATLPFAQGRSTGGALSQAILQGLAEGDRVVTSGQINLSDGMAVEPVKEDTLSSAAPPVPVAGR